MCSSAVVTFSQVLSGEVDEKEKPQPLRGAIDTTHWSQIPERPLCSPAPPTADRLNGHPMGRGACCVQPSSSLSPSRELAHPTRAGEPSVIEVPTAASSHPPGVVWALLV